MVLIASVVSDSVQPYGRQPAMFLCLFSGERILEWVAMSSSRGSSQPRDWTHVSYIPCIGKQILYHLCHLGSPRMYGTWNLMKAQENAFAIDTTGIMKKWDKLGYLDMYAYIFCWLFHILKHTSGTKHSIFYWEIVDSQGFANLCCIAKGLSYTYIDILSGTKYFKEHTCNRAYIARQHPKSVRCLVFFTQSLFLFSSILLWT